MIDTNDSANTGKPAIILCGGRSSRMGQDKASLMLGSQTVLRHVELRFQEFAGRRVIVAGYRHKLPGTLDDSVVVHDERAGLGPLEGLRVGLTYCLENLPGPLDCVFVGTCDAPLILPAAYRLLLNRLGEHEAVAPFIGGKLYPLTAVYRIGALDTIEQMMRRGELKARDLFQQLNGCRIDESEWRRVDPELATLENINTMEDYRRLTDRQP